MKAIHAINTVWNGSELPEIHGAINYSVFLHSGSMQMSGAVIPRVVSTNADYDDTNSWLLDIMNMNTSGGTRTATFPAPAYMSGFPSGSKIILFNTGDGVFVVDVNGNEVDSSTQNRMIFPDGFIEFQKIGDDIRIIDNKLASFDVEPDDIANLELWIEPFDRSTVTETGSFVDILADKSVNGHEFSGDTTTRPTVITDGVTTGKDSIEFTLNDFLNAGNVKLHNNSVGRGLYGMAVVKPVAANDYFLSKWASGQNEWYFGTSRTRIYDTLVGDYSSVSYSSDLDNWQIIEFKWTTGEGVKVYANGSLRGTGVIRTDIEDGTADLIMGDAVGLSDYLGEVAGAVFYSRQITNVEQMYVRDYFAGILSLNDIIPVSTQSGTWERDDLTNTITPDNIGDTIDLGIGETIGKGALTLTSLSGKTTETNVLYINDDGHVTSGATSSGATSIWGGIGGTLSNQTDLYSELTGITANTTAISTKLDTNLFNTYTGDTQPVIDSALTGVTNLGTGTTLSSVSGRDATTKSISVLGGLSLSGDANNLIISGQTGSTGGGTAWGDITGTLSGQTDLWNELTGKTETSDFIGSGDTTVAVSGDSVIIYTEPDEGFPNIVTVAPSGATFTSIQAAIDSITDAATDNRYVIDVKVGTYNEDITLKPYVFVRGIATSATIVNGSLTVDSSSYGYVLTKNMQFNTWNESTLNVSTNLGARFENVAFYSYWSGETQIKHTINIDKGVVLIGGDSSIRLIDEYTGSTVTQAHLIYAYGTDAITFDLKNSKISKKIYNNNAEIGFIHNTNTNAKTKIILDDFDSLIYLYGSSPANNIKSILQLGAAGETHLSDASITIDSTNSANLNFIPIYSSGSTTGDTIVEFMNSVIGWNRNVDDSDVYLAAAVTSTDEIRVNNVIYNTYYNVLPDIYEDDGYDGKIDFKIMNGWGISYSNDKSIMLSLALGNPGSQAVSTISNSITGASSSTIVTELGITSYVNALEFNASVISGGTLLTTVIPDLDTSKITTGIFDTDRLATGATTGNFLKASSSSTQVWDDIEITDVVDLRTELDSKLGTGYTATTGLQQVTDINAVTTNESTFSSGLVTNKIRPSGDTATAIQINNATGGTIVNFNTISGHTGFGTTTPRSKIHIYETDADTDHSSFIIDGDVDINKSIAWAEDNRDRWHLEILGEQDAEFIYLHAIEPDENIMTIMDTGRIGFNKQTNVLDPDAAPVVNSGLDDIRISGTYTKNYNAVYEVEIATTGTPDTFKWRKSIDAALTFDTWSSTSGVTTTPTEIENGVQVQWDNTTGHTIGTRWRFGAFTQIPQATVTIAPMAVDEVLTSDDYDAGTMTYHDITARANGGEYENSGFLIFNSGTTGTNQALYFGTKVFIHSVYLNLLQTDSSSTLIVEYYNGSSWIVLNDVDNELIDHTNNLSQSGQIIWSPYSMTGWQRTNLPDLSSDEYYQFWMRIRTSTNPTNDIRGRGLSIGNDKRFSVYSSHNDYRPAMFVDSRGRMSVGGGTITGKNEFQVSKVNVCQYIAGLDSQVEFDTEDSSAAMFRMKLASDDDKGYCIGIGKFRGTLLNSEPVINGDDIGKIFWGAQTGVGSSFSAEMNVEYTGDNTTPLADIVFSTQNALGSITELTEVLRITGSGNTGFGGITVPTAKIHVTSGTTTVAPLKFNTGDLLTTPETGAVEFDGTNWYGTITGDTRKTFAFSEDISAPNLQTVTDSGAVTTNESTFSSGLVTNKIRPSGDTITAIQINNATGGTIINVDTVSGLTGFGTTAPQGLIHAYGVDTSDSEYESTQTNSIIIDGVAGADKDIAWFEDGDPRWLAETYRNEDAEFWYLYAVDADNSPLTIMRTGRIGVNKITNIIHDHVSTIGDIVLNDLHTTGLYTQNYDTVYQIQINGTGATDTFHWKKSIDGAYSFTDYSPSSAVTTTEIELEYGVKIYFDNLSGHTSGDTWQFAAFSQIPQATMSIAPMPINEILHTDDYDAGTIIYNDITAIANGGVYDSPFNVFNSGVTGTQQALYWGTNIPIHSIYYNKNSIAIGVNLITEYWNGTTWVAMTFENNNYIDATNNLSKSGQIIWTPDTMTNWGYLQLPDTTGDNFQKYWIRIRTSTNPTNDVIGDSLSAGNDKRLGVYGAFSDYTPNFYVNSSGKVSIGGGNIAGSNMLQVSKAQHVDLTSTASANFIEFDTEDGESADVKVRLSSDDACPASFTFAKTRGTLDTSTGVLNGDCVGRLRWRTRIGNGGHTLSEINAEYTGDGVSAHGDLVIHTINGSVPVERIRIKNTGTGFGVSTPTAIVHLQSGSTSIAPLKFNTGDLLSSPETGAVEFDGTNWYGTITGDTRKTFAFLESPVFTGAPELPTGTTLNSENLYEFILTSGGSDNSGFVTTTDYNQYTGDTDTRLDGIDDNITYVSGVTDTKLSIDTFNIYSGTTQPWTHVSKVGSSIADLETHDASDVDVILPHWDDDNVQDAIGDIGHYLEETQGSGRIEPETVLGGEMTTDLIVYSGRGYITYTDYHREIIWSGETISVSGYSEGTYYVYVDINGDIQISSSNPDGIHNIRLGLFYHGGNFIGVIQQCGCVIENAMSRTIEFFLRLGYFIYDDGGEIQVMSGGTNKIVSPPCKIQFGLLDTQLSEITSEDATGGTFINNYKSADVGWEINYYFANPNSGGAGGIQTLRWNDITKDSEYQLTGYTLNFTSGSSVVTSTSDLTALISAGTFIFKTSDGHEHMTPVTGVTWTGSQTNIGLKAGYGATGGSGEATVDYALPFLPDGKYAKQLILRSSDDKMFSIFAQTYYDTEEEAVAGVLPAIPDALVSNGIKMAYIVAVKGETDLSDKIYDIRPLPFHFREGGQAGGGATVTSHSDLTNLAADDHLQYLRTDGSRNITGIQRYQSEPAFTTDLDVVTKKYVDELEHQYENVLIVAKSGATYNVINDAINDATSNDVIYVKPGTYNENLIINKNINLVGSCGKKTKIIGKTTFTNSSSAIIFKSVGFENTNDFAIDIQCGDDNGKISLVDCYADTVWNSSVTGQTVSTSKSSIKVSRGFLSVSRGRYTVVASGDSVTEHNTSIYWLTSSYKIDLNVFGAFQTITNTTDSRQNLEVIFNNNSNANTSFVFKNGNIKFFGVVDNNNYTTPFYSLFADNLLGVIEGNLIQITDTGHAYCAFNWVSDTEILFSNNSILPVNVSDLYAASSNSGQINVSQNFFNITTKPQTSANVYYSMTNKNGALYLSGELYVGEKINLTQFTNTGLDDGDFWYDGDGLHFMSGTTSIDLLAESGIWGTITGTLSNQTDLQNALDAKEDTITGAATTITASDLTNNRALVSNGSGKVSVSPTTLTQIGYLSGVTSDIQSQIDLKSPLLSPTFTGVPAAPTAGVNTSTTQLATTAYVLNQAADSNPIMDGTVAIGTSMRYARQDHVHASDTSRLAVTDFNTFTGTTVPIREAIEADIIYLSGQTDLKLFISDFNTFTGTTLSTDYYNKTEINAYSAATASQINLKANINSPTFTGVPTAPTAAVNTNTTQLATTAWYINQGADTAPVMDGTVAIGTSMRYARQDHVHASDTSRLAVTDFNTFTGTTLPADYYNKTEINNYTGATDTRIDGIDTRIDGIDTRLDGVDDDITGLTATTASLQAQINSYSGVTGLSTVQVRRTTNVTLNSSTYVNITFDTTDVETNVDDIEHDDTDTERIDIKKDGTYLIIFDSEAINVGSAETINLQIVKNSGSTLLSGGEVEVLTYNDETHKLSKSFIAELSEDDYIYARANTSGTNTVINADINFGVVLLEGVRGETGAKGDKGDDGSGSSILVYDNGTNAQPTGGTFNTLNFIGFDLSGGTEQVNIEKLPTHPMCVLVDGAGGQELNVVTPVVITWNTQDRIDTEYFSHTGGTGVITVLKAGLYEVSYNVNSDNQTANRSTTGVQVRISGDTLIGPTLSADYSRNTSNDDNHNALTPYPIDLLANDTIEIVGFRLGDDNSTLTKADASFVRINYLNE